MTKAWNSTLNICWKPLKRSPLKKPKPYRRTPAQRKYHKENPNCIICKHRALSTPHHIDWNKGREDSPENMESLCRLHHWGPRGPHSLLGFKRFVEENHLEDDPKWKPVYGRVKNKGVKDGKE